MIKFKGKKFNGEEVKGGIAGNDYLIYIKGQQVDYKSVRQLIGYDSDGAEIYEGDTVQCKVGGEKFEMHINYFSNGSEGGFISGQLGSKIPGVKKC